MRLLNWSVCLVATKQNCDYVYLEKVLVLTSVLATGLVFSELCIWRAVKWLLKWELSRLTWWSCFLTAFLCGRAVRIQSSPVCPTACTLRSVWKQEEEEQHQAVCTQSFHHGQLWGADPRVSEWVYFWGKCFPKSVKLLSTSEASLHSYRNSLGGWLSPQQSWSGSIWAGVKVLLSLSELCGNQLRILKGQGPLGGNWVIFSVWDLQSQFSLSSSRFHERCGRFWGFASEHFSWNAAAKQDPESHPEELGEEVLRTFHWVGWRQGELQKVLRAVLQEHQGL